eukprot:gene8297-biopygen10158
MNPYGSGIRAPHRLRLAFLPQIRFLSVCKNPSRKPVTCAAADDDRQEQLLASVTFIGLTGTLALAAGAVSGVNIVQYLHWDDASGILLGLQLFLPLLLLDAFLFGCGWSIPSTVLAGNCRKHVSDAADASNTSKTHDGQQNNIIDLAAVVQECNSSRSSVSWRLLLALYPVLLLLAVGRAAAKAMLEQGFMLTFLARWLTDRMYEAGVDDVVSIPGVLNQQLQVELPQFGLWVAAVLTTAIWAPSAFYLAETTQQDVSAMMLLSSEAGSIVRTPAAASSSSSSSNATGGTQSTTSATSTVITSPSAQHQNSTQETNMEEADEEKEDSTMDQLVREYRLLKATKMCFDSSPAKLAYSLGLFKELARIVMANVCYVGTRGNLAAVVISSVAVNGLLLLYAAQKQQQVAPGLLQLAGASIAERQQRQES